MLCFATGYLANAQSFSELKKSNGENPFTADRFKLFARLTSINSEYTPSYTGLTLNIGVSRNSYEAGRARIRYENPLLGDLIQGIPRAIKDIRGIKNDEQTSLTENKWSDHSHSGGFGGWFQYYINAAATKRCLISPGISVGDYTYGSQYADPSGSKRKQDPYGYFFVAGPALLASYVVSPSCWIDGYVNYDLTVYKVETGGTETYPKPNFMSIGADVYTTRKLFMGLRLNKLIDKGINNDDSSRLDISGGIVF